MNDATFIQLLQCRAAAAGHQQNAIAIAKTRHGQNSITSQLLQKAAILTTADFANDEDFLAARRGFMALVRARSLTGQIAGWRKTGFHIPTLAAAISANGSFVREGRAIPVAENALVPLSLPTTAIKTIVVTTKEVATGAGANFESGLSGDLVRAIANAEAMALLDPANAGLAGVSPASILNGVTAIPSTGEPAADLTALVRNFTGDLSQAVLVSSPATAIALHGAGYEGAGPRGGDVAGLPLFTSGGVPSDGSGSLLVLLDPSRILLADEGADVELAQHADLEVSSTPANPTVAATVMVSLWQRGLVGFLGTRRVGWLAAPGAVAYVNGVDY